MKTIDAIVAEAKRAHFARRKDLHPGDYRALLDLMVTGRRVRTWHEAHTDSDDGRILMIRHDIDHDLETARRMAAWEAEQGLRTTYCVLHTAWYYGDLVDGRYEHTRDVVEGITEIAALGHEINLHNNSVVVGLREGVDPWDLLDRELTFWRDRDVAITGTSTHGDALCRDLDFRNYEIFAECVWESRGGHRVVEMEGHRVELGARSMADLGLDYEAYDLPRDVYATDSGGNPRLRLGTKGRGGLRRPDLDVAPSEVAAILTHPVWWDFTGGTTAGPPEPHMAQLLAELKDIGEQGATTP